MSITELFRRIEKLPKLQALSVAFAAFILVSALNLFGAFDTLESQSFDYRLLHVGVSQKADTSVVLVTIDQNSLDFFEKQSVSWPWPREFYGVLTDYLTKAGAKVVAYDLDFSSKGVDRVESESAYSDSSFSAAMGLSGNVVLTAHLWKHEAGDEEGGTLLPKHLTPPISINPKDAFNRATAPLELFQEQAARVGVVNFETDEDGVARRLPLCYAYQNRSIPHFALAAYMQALKIPNEKIASTLKTIPTDAHGNHLVYWYGKPGPDGVFKYISIASVITSAYKQESGGAPEVPPEIFRDKYVIVGASAPGLWDFKPTPFASLEPCPGMEIHATVLSNLLNNHFIKSTPVWLIYVISLVFALVVGFLFFSIKRLSLSVATILGALGLYIGFAFWGFSHLNLWAPLVMPSAVALSTLMLSAIVSYATEGRQKRELRRIFTRYLSPQVMDEIIANADKLELGGQEVQASVFFSDIQGFTSIAEKLPPKELIAYLNEYLTIGTEIILKYEGMIDKYIGDAIMAIFGAPVTRPDHAKTACLAALEIQKITDTFYASKSHVGPQFITRIGIHTGTMVLGNVGSATRSDYTAIGDTVNLASRLEGVNKNFGTRILISESTYEQAKQFIEVRELDVLRVKGKNQPIKIYELVCEKGGLSQLQIRKFKHFEDGIKHYRAQAWNEAKLSFENVLKLDREDGPAEAYIERCGLLSVQNLSENWDGVFTLTTK
ncbi:MAG: adenylate/guanylate cyclase domain-containing protein [Chlorobiales bacterium]|nr:adenylate/guanylate cyclase domain-containing protein [Chlorobiales bacterium]